MGNPYCSCRLTRVRAGPPKGESGGYRTFSLPDGEVVAVQDDDFPHRVAEKFFFDPLKLDWEDTSMEESVQQKVMAR